jgi:hypothetical protein
MLGGWPVPLIRGVSCEEQIDAINRLGAQDPGERRGKRPPLLRVRGNVRHGGRQWVVDDVQWSTEAKHTVVVRGVVVKARCTIVLRRFVGVDLVNPDAASRRKDGGAARRYTVKRGETAWEIAKDEVGTRGSREARQAIRLFTWGSGPRRGQRVRDPRAIRAGDVLILPRRELTIVSQGKVEYR